MMVITGSDLRRCVTLARDDPSVHYSRSVLPYLRADRVA